MGAYVKKGKYDVIHIARSLLIVLFFFRRGSVGVHTSLIPELCLLLVFSCDGGIDDFRGIRLLNGHILAARAVVVHTEP